MKRFLLLTFFLVSGLAASESTHWAFQPVTDVGLPDDLGESPTALDAWHEAALKKQGLERSPTASREVLARRLAYHLHGLPPEPSAAQPFVDDPSPNAVSRHVDRLLASPRFGERWARHWMDVARYADNKGYVFEEERRYPYAYTYRDWLVTSFNHDLPYDAFITQQIAGDHVATVSGDSKAHAALGFLTLGRRFLNRQPDIIDDRIDVVTRGVLGLTVACARCHDHKSDPIPIEDYYSLYGVFASSYEPDEKPLLGEADTTSPDYQQYLKEAEEHQAAIDRFFNERHAKLRTAPVLEAYFRLVHEGREWDDTRLSSQAQSEKLYQKIALRWRDRITHYLDENHPVFVPWKALAEGRSLETVKSESHPLIWQALADARVSSIETLIPIVAKTIAEANAEEPHEDAHLEALRQLLVAKDSPTGLKPEALYRIFNTPDQQAVRRLRREREKHQALSPGAPPRGMTLLDKEKPVEPHVFVRGNERVRGDQVPRQYLAVLSGEERKPFARGSGRAELAEALVAPGNPLTARVLVNRVWLHLFGAAIVESPSDFGVQTAEPDLRHVMDRLASDFMRDGWSMKKLIREVVSSRAYRQDSVASEKALEEDPENRWFTRMNRQRLGFESMRDALISVGQGLDLKTGGHAVALFEKPFTPRRALYGFIDRQNLPSTFRTFDMASPDAHTPQRLETIVPQQALFMMNGPLVEEQAARLGRASEVKADRDSPSKAIAALYHQLYFRAPAQEEVALGEMFVENWQATDAFANAWEAYAHALLCANEFLFID